MGISPLHLLSFDSNGIHSNEEMLVSNGSLRGKLSEAQAKRRMKVKKQTLSSTRKKARHVRPRSILMKRRPRQEGSRRPANHFEKKVRTLKKLIPNNKSMGLDGLLRETAEYILSLQMRVNVMQIVVRLLTGSNE